MTEKGEGSVSEWAASVSGVVLPQWLTDCLPDKPEFRLIRQAADGQTFEAVDGEGIVTDPGFVSVEAAYGYFKNCANGPFEIEIDDHSSAENIGGIVFNWIDSYTNGMSLLKSAYRDWVETAHPAWLADPNNWVKAYNWLEDHPVFWTRYGTEKTVHWVTNSGLSSNYVMVGLDDDGNPIVGMEHGPHHAPDYTECSHDFRTEAYAKNFEEAYVALAKIFHTLYSKDGNARCTEKDSVWNCDLDAEEPCQKHAHIFKTLREHDDDSNWAFLVEELWAASDAS